MRLFTTIAKKIWNSILDAIAWVTRDSERLNKSKSDIKPEHMAEIMRMRNRFGRF